MNIENKIRELLESVDEKTPAQMSYPGATGPQDPAPYMGVNFEELELDRPGVVSDEIQQVQYPGQTMPDPEPIGPEFQELDPYNMAPTIQEVPKENYPIGSGADDVQSPQDPAASMQPDEYSAGIQPAQHPAPFVAEETEVDDPSAVPPQAYQAYKPAKVSAKAQGQHIVVLDKNTAATIEKKLGLPKGALAPVQGGRYSETVVVKGKDNKLHTVYAKDDVVRARSYGHTDQDSTKALADHLNEALSLNATPKNINDYTDKDKSWSFNGKRGRDINLTDGPYDRKEMIEFDHKGNPTGKRHWVDKHGNILDDNGANTPSTIKNINDYTDKDKSWSFNGKKGRDINLPDGPYDRKEMIEFDHKGNPTGKRHWVDTHGNILEALDAGQQVDPVDQQNDVMQQAVQAVEAGNKIEDVAKATGLDVQAIQAAIEAAQPTASPAAPQTTAPVSESVNTGSSLGDFLNKEGFDTVDSDGKRTTYTHKSKGTVAIDPTGWKHQVPNTETSHKGSTEKELISHIRNFRKNFNENFSEHGIQNILGEETLSEEFKSKAAALFESTVVSRVNEEVKRIEEVYDSKLSTEIQSLQEQYVQAVETFAEKQSTRLNSYINYLGEQWIKQNRVALHQGIRTDLTEGFMKGLQKLFTEHYINVPTEKVDLVAEQKAEIEKLQESINEMSAKVETLEESNHNLKRDAVIMKVSEGLTDTEAAKLNSLCEGVSFESEDLFESKINMIKNNFFKRKAAPSPEQLLESTIHTSHEEDKKVAIQTPNMERYIAALNKFKQ